MDALDLFSNLILLLLYLGNHLTLLGWLDVPLHKVLNDLLTKAMGGHLQIVVRIWPGTALYTRRQRQTHI